MIRCPAVKEETGDQCIFQSPPHPGDHMTKHGDRWNEES